MLGLSLRSPTDRRFLLSLACWLLVLYWHFVRDATASEPGGALGAVEGGGAASAWRSRHAEAAMAAIARGPPAPAPSRQPSHPVRGAAPPPPPPPPPPPLPPPAGAPPFPGTPDGLQVHGEFSVSPSWPQREFRCPVPVVLPSEVERYKRISGLYRNLSSTLPHFVRGWAAVKRGGAAGGGDAATAAAASAAGVAPMSLLRVQALEVQRFVGMQEDVLERFGVAMQVNDRHDLRLMSPAVVHIGGGRFLLFARISCYPAELYDNLLWSQELDEALDPVPGTGAVIGVPTHSQFLMAPGPEDPRAIVLNGEVLVLFNHQFRNDDRRMLIYNHMQKRLSQLSVEGLIQARAEKNWMPFVHEGALHLVYQMTPLIVIRCALPSGACVCVVPEGGCQNTQAVSKGVVSRGGTPLTRVGDNLFFGLLHSTYRHHMIRAHMVFLSTAPWGWVTLGGPLPMPEGLPGCFEGQVPWDVQFPASALLLGPRADALLMGIHVRDAMSALIHVDLGGAGMPDILAEVTALSCEEPGGEDDPLRAPEAPPHVRATSLEGAGGFFSSEPWRTREGATVPSCKRWATIADGALDSLLVPMLH
jgi:hypothetical protein